MQNNRNRFTLAPYDYSRRLIEHSLDVHYLLNFKLAIISMKYHTITPLYIPKMKPPIPIQNYL